MTRIVYSTIIRSHDAEVMQMELHDYVDLKQNEGLIVSVKYHAVADIEAGRVLYIAFVEVRKEKEKWNAH